MIPNGFKGRDNCIHGCPAIEIQHELDIFDYNKWRRRFSQERKDAQYQRGLVSGDSTLLAYRAKVLTRKSCTKHIDTCQVVGMQLAHIPNMPAFREVPRNDRIRSGVKLA
jgi:hypothetical protein